MKAVDTNVFVRRIAKDDALQTELAEAAFASPVYLATGVLLETEWVLRSIYRWPRERIGNALSTLLSVRGVTVENAEGMFWAIDRYRAGADWADMLHLVASRRCDVFRHLRPASRPPGGCSGSDRDREAVLAVTVGRSQPR